MLGIVCANCVCCHCAHLSSWAQTNRPLVIGLVWRRKCQSVMSVSHRQVSVPVTCSSSAITSMQSFVSLQMILPVVLGYVALLSTPSCHSTRPLGSFEHTLPDYSSTVPVCMFFRDGLIGWAQWTLVFRSPVVALMMA